MTAIATKFNEPVIEMSELSKFYGKVMGIDDINLTVNKGEIHGFLGPNGAGKTTTIRILVGLLKQSRGNATIYGHPAGSLAAKNSIGYLPSDFELYKHYTVLEYLNYIATLRGGSPYMDELISRFQVETDKKTGQLSRGNRQKVAIVQALMHEPQILIADEPTTGLDPLMQAEFNNYLTDYIERGNTAFISSHLLAEVQDICSIVTVIKHGHIIQSGKVDDLLSGMPRKAIIKLSKPIPSIEIANKLDARPGHDFGDKVSVYFICPVNEIVPKIQQLPNVIDYALPEPSLEEYFLPIYGR